ncbi:Lipid-binding SYLF domain-containing protein [Humidesulfovibrio mexicanus]|uniref:Lipid-binding SYLF domain-containing protein n=1 Tax=Humidesulfovibrio mexicanus TaxID=147047 RepID=A0A238Z5X0_9BACT|nr:lipid-binding SYLF domain-containing protein [Humidesulfovibrio mexicanus]SNR78776.1 Lipid-binding SYLF domain-containing protein [Humidesulfovibrio mexicanus]
MRTLALASLLGLCALPVIGACAGSASHRAAAPVQTQQEARRRSPEAALVEQSAHALREIRIATAERVLDDALPLARAVVILPGVYQAGLMYSIHAGNGVLVARRPDGGWGAPVFVSVAGAGYGWQAGLERSRVVLVITEEEMVERLLSGASLDLGASAKYDVLGVREETGVGRLTTEQPVMTFADGVGIMAGVAFRGGALSLDRGRTRTYHANPDQEAEATARTANAPGLEVFELWAALGVIPELPGEGNRFRRAKP